MSIQILFCSVILLTIGSVCIESVTLYTKPINVSIFEKSSLPTDHNSIIGADVLLNANKYGLNSWWNLWFHNQTSKYLNLYGIDEYHIRAPAMEALAVAVSLKTKVYNQSFVGKTTEEALNVTKRLLTSLAYRHKSNTGGGWGDQWESALWTSHVGLGAWLLWDQFDENDKHLLENMIIHEANRFNNYDVPYYADKTGLVLHKGDTKAEENAWNANTVQIALAMMPTHPNLHIWLNKNIELALSSFARHSDLVSQEIYHGKPLKDWLHGSNIFENGTLVNHNIIHPDYMICIYSNLEMLLTQTLAQRPVPKAALFNVELVYNSLVNLKWPSPPYPQPGGTIYMKDKDGKLSNTLYYPQGDDWGKSRRIGFANLDNTIDKFFDFSKKLDANEWSRVHIEAQHQMQLRYKDGHTYGSHDEDTYQRREEWVSCMAAYNYLSSWVNHNLKYIVTNSINY